MGTPTYYDIPLYSQFTLIVTAIMSKSLFTGSNTRYEESHSDNERVTAVSALSESKVPIEPQRTMDDAVLSSLGYKAELKREFSKTELLGASFSIMCVAPSIATILVEMIPAGGVGMSWGWFVPSFFIFVVGLTMSEMASAMPTAGGLYWWTYVFAPDSFKSYLSFLCGYSDVFGLIGAIGSINYGAANQVLSSVEMGTGYTSSNGVTYAVFLGLCFLQVLFCLFPLKYMAKIQLFNIVLNLTGVCLLCIALPVGCLVKGISLNPGKFIFSDTSNYTAYPYGMSFMLAWMAAIWTISSHDCCVHLCEEATNATTAVPYGIITSISLCWVLGFVIMCVLAAVIDMSEEGIDNLLNATLPMANIIERCLNSTWSIGIMSLFAVIQCCMGFGALMSSSRLVYAFARDDALPFSRILKKTSKQQLPVPALICAAFIAALIGLLILAGPTAANAIFSLSMSAVYMGWMIPIWNYALQPSKSIMNPGPFYLGHFWSKVAAIVSSAYGTYVIFGLSMLPSDVPVTNAETMNYSCVVCGGIWLFISLYWLIDARKWYRGPRMNLESKVIEAQEYEQLECKYHKKEFQ